MNKLQTLQHYFGHDSFREQQEEVIDAILDQQDLLMILPTGGGKSLCYQVRCYGCHLPSSRPYA